MPWQEGKDSGVQPHKFNGKRWVEAHGYDMYDYHARGLYPTISRFTTIDPLAEIKPWLTPYHYCSNNPVNRIDPDGMDDFYIIQTSDSTYSIVIVPTSDKTPNRLFVQDLNADENTENRKEHEGQYFEMVMIPSSEYEDEDYRPLGLWGVFGQSQFDLDRDAYIRKGGDYTDKNWFERASESINDDLVTISNLSILLNRKKSGNNGSSGFQEHRKGKKWQKHSKPRPGGDPASGRYGQGRNSRKGNNNQKYIPPKNPNKRK